jgi:hypothetical protein
VTARLNGLNSRPACARYLNGSRWDGADDGILLVLERGRPAASTISAATEAIKIAFDVS